MWLLVSVGVFAVRSRIKDPVGEYLEVVKKFQQFEVEALKVYSFPPGTPDENIVAELKSKSIPNWRKAQVELGKLNDLELPENLRKTRSLIQQYTNIV